MLTAIVIAILFGGFQQTPPDSLSLEYCHSKIENEYPLARKVDLQQQIADLNKRIANTNSYPQLNFGISATFQSEVTELQFPAGGQSTGPDLSKDQYKATMEVSQSIYNGGAVGIRKKLAEIEGQREEQATRVQLHKIKEQVNEVYFGILLAQQQIKIVSTMLESLRAQITDVRAKVENGVLLADQQHILEAELIKTQQDSAEIRSNIQSGYEVLSQLIGEQVTAKTSLKIPDTRVYLAKEDSLTRLRPEFKLFDTHRTALDYQEELAGTNLWPSLSAFGTAAYGRPGFNVFENDLHPYYIVGLHLKWSLWGAQNAATRQQVHSLQQKNIRQEERAFERQLQAGLNKIRQRIYSLEYQIKRDQQIMDLRQKVVASVSSQMKNGAATATEYVTELNKVTQAQLSMEMHKTRLARAKVDYRTTLGLSNKGSE